jgi:hypothetical protein
VPHGCGTFLFIFAACIAHKKSDPGALYLAMHALNPLCESFLWRLVAIRQKEKLTVEAIWHWHMTSLYATSQKKKDIQRVHTCMQAHAAGAKHGGDASAANLASAATQQLTKEAIQARYKCISHEKASRFALGIPWFSYHGSLNWILFVVLIYDDMCEPLAL